MFQEPLRFLRVLSVEKGRLLSGAAFPWFSSKREINMTLEMLKLVALPASAISEPI